VLKLSNLRKWHPNTCSWILWVYYWMNVFGCHFLRLLNLSTPKTHWSEGYGK